MAKKNYYFVKASKGNLGDTIAFEKIVIIWYVYMEGNELRFTVEEAKWIFR